ncbi:MAG: hypothetical protein LLG04_17520 [Parachlamydia sp.]|nr:hypothetical protein [Parachlamydia sp.]
MVYLFRDIFREEHGLSLVGLDDVTSNNAKVAKDFYLALSSLLEYLHRKPLRQEVLTYFQDLLVKQPVIVTIQHIEFLNSNKDSILNSRSNWDEYKKWVNTSVAIQGEIMGTAQGITRSDQIPAKIAQQLVTIFNTNAASILEIQRQQPDLIPKCLAFGISNEAAGVVIRLLNQFIKTIQIAPSKAGAKAP